MMKDWEDCKEKKKVKEIQENPEQARSLLILAKRRMKSIEKRKEDEYPQLLLESYYEAIKELLTALLALDGYKSYSHECLISYINDIEPDLIEYQYTHLIDDLRLLRSDIIYRGRDIAQDYLFRNLDDIERIIEILIDALEKRLDDK
ncbi:MAG: hypothetical protein R6U61_06950 [Thermoplasmata archaeon]